MERTLYLDQIDRYFRVQPICVIKVTKSMNITLNDLWLDHLYVVFPETMQFPLHDNIAACGLDGLKEIKI